LAAQRLDLSGERDAAPTFQQFRDGLNDQLVRRLIVLSACQAAGPEAGRLNILLITFLKGDTMNTIKNFLKDETGLELSEYAVAAALIAVALITAFTNLGSAIKGKINALIAALGGTQA
jgi:pilus assembly protein Flp/PilA